MYSCNSDRMGFSMQRRFWRFGLIAILVCAPGLNSRALSQDSATSTPSADVSKPQKLRDIIDVHFQSDLPKALMASDAEFARRVSIDLIGMPLDAERLKSFLKDKNENKREQLVLELVATPHFERRLVTFLDNTLMERRAYKDIKEDAWIGFLLKSVRENKPWNVLAREILSADGSDDVNRAAVRFALVREAEPNLLTRDIGRVFFGRDLQCAQCHNHPLVEDYLQSDYQGLMAFVAPGYIKTIQKPGPKTKDGKPGKKIATKIYAEKDGNDINFESVFVKNTKHRTGPRLIGEKSILEEDRLPVSVSSRDRPETSRRDVMATRATNGSNVAFNENMANRLWGMMLGRGLVHPPDFHHRDNPPVKPELLNALGKKFQEMKYDMRSFLVEIALSKVYQRAYELPELSNSYAEVESRIKSAKESKAKLDQEVSEAVTKYDQALQQWAGTESKLIPVALEVEKQRKAFVAATNELSKSQTAASAARVAQKRDADIQNLLKSAIAKVDAAVAKMADKDVLQLKQTAEAKLKKVASSAVTTAKKSQDADKKLKTGQIKEQSAKDALNKGYAKRKPIRVEFDQKESEARRLRSELERLVSLRGSIESKIATLEKVLSHHELRSKLANSKPESSGENDKLQMELDRLEDSLVIRFSRNHWISSLRPLTPEQLGWSTMKVTGFYQRYLTAEETKLRKELKLASDAKLDLTQRRTIEERTHKVLKGHLNNFIRFYAAGAGQPQGDFFATADQALFSANSGTINSYVNPAAGNVTDRMMKAKTNQAAAEELYLSVLSRMPVPDEIAEVDSYLNSKKDNKRQAVMELAWSLINSAEFRFNH